MSGRADRHLDRETAERFSLGKLSARTAGQLEEHLLVCARCRQIVKAADRYVAAMKEAAEKLRKTECKPKPRTPRKTSSIS